MNFNALQKQMETLQLKLFDNCMPIHFNTNQKEKEKHLYGSLWAAVKRQGTRHDTHIEEEIQCKELVR